MYDNIYQVIINALLAAFGAMARQLNIMHKEKLRPAVFISGCFIAAFMGVIIFFFTDYFGFSGSIAYAAAGISGWIGPQILDKLGYTIMRTVGLHQDKRPDNRPDNRPDDKNDKEDKAAGGRQMDEYKKEEGE